MYLMRLLPAQLNKLGFIRLFMAGHLLLTLVLFAGCIAATKEIRCASQSNRLPETHQNEMLLEQMSPFEERNLWQLDSSDKKIAYNLVDRLRPRCFELAFYCRMQEVNRQTFHVIVEANELHFMPSNPEMRISVVNEESGCVGVYQHSLGWRANRFAFEVIRDVEGLGDLLVVHSGHGMTDELQIRRYYAIAIAKRNVSFTPLGFPLVRMASERGELFPMNFPFFDGKSQQNLSLANLESAMKKESEGNFVLLLDVLTWMAGKHPFAPHKSYVADELEKEKKVFSEKYADVLLQHSNAWIKDAAELVKSRIDEGFGAKSRFSPTGNIGVRHSQ